LLHLQPKHDISSYPRKIQHGLLPQPISLVGNFKPWPAPLLLSIAQLLSWGKCPRMSQSKVTQTRIMIGKTDAVGGSLHQRIAQMPLVDLCAPADLHSLFLLDVGDSSSLLRDPVPAHLAAPPRRPLRGGVKTERRSGGRARGAAAQAHRDGVHVELVAGMSFFRSPAPSTPSPRPGLRRGGEAAEMAVGKPAGAVVARGGHRARSDLLLPRRPRRKIRSPVASSSPPAAAASSSLLASQIWREGKLPRARPT